MGNSIFKLFQQTDENKPGDGVSQLFGAASEEATCSTAAAFQPDPTWQPKTVSRRVEIMVSGNLGRVGDVRNTVNGLQDTLFKNMGDADMEMRITAFLDGCRHSTPWSNSPQDVGGATTRWHCHQGDTRFVDALTSTNREDDVDAIIIYGDRFDDNLRETLRLAGELKEKGTRIFAIQPPYDERWDREEARTGKAYEQIAAQTGGVYLKLTDQRAFSTIMPIITDYLLRKDEALTALPSANSPDVKNLVRQLKDLRSEP